jgi:diguanylate cyclase (GGDEF)-like protein/PAS domain S-box-containing protein
VIDETTSRQGRARRVAFLVREHGLLEAGVVLGAGQALAEYIESRRGLIDLVDAVWVASGTRVEQLPLRQSEIVWARPLDPEVMLVNVSPFEGENLSVEVALSGGTVARGRFRMIPGQSISEHLNSMGRFPVLWGAHLKATSQALGDIAINRQAIESARDVSGVSMRQAWIRGIPGAGTPRSHWLLRAARDLGFDGCSALSISQSTPITEVWRQVCSAASLSEEELAEALSRHLRIAVVDAAALAEAEAEQLPEAVAERYGVRAVASDGRTLTVATADPMDADVEQALSFACNRRIVFAIATPRSLGLVAPPAAEPGLEELLSHARLSATAVTVEEEAEQREVEVDDAITEPVIRLANLILRDAVRQLASDIHLEPDQGRGIVRFRIDGMLRPYMHIPLNALHRVISRYKVVGRLDIADRVRPQDGRVRIRVDGRPYELRLSTVPTQDAEKAVIRIAGSVQEQTLDQLQLSVHELQRLRQLLSYRDGIVIVTGPTGSGKTTTLYGALNELNTGEVNIMTVEDPIERALPGVTQIQVQSRRGVTFASALRAILRQDPDIILLGEIRDLETAQIAVQAATTGHLVLTTLHTTSAVGVVARLRDLGLESTSLSGSLRGIVAQRLVRRSCADCRGTGCELCAGTGYRGRMPLMEVLTVTPSFGDLVGRGARYHDLQLAAEQDGMRPMRDVAAATVAAGLTTSEEVARVLGEAEDELKMQAAFTTADNRIEGESRAALPVGPEGEPGALAETAGTAGLPARLTDFDDQEASWRRRADVIRALLQGLDRCVADGQSISEVFGFACEQIANAFDSPLVWIADVESGTPEIRARAGTCAPYVRDLVPDWEDLEESDGAVATAIRTGMPQGRRLDDEPGFETWREHARAHGLPLFIVVPMLHEGTAVGVIGMHARSMAGLDRQAGNELLNVSDRLAGVAQRLRQLEAAGLQLSALELAADCVFMTDRSGVIQWVNRSFTQLTGFTAVEAIGQSPRILRSARQDAAFFAEMWNTILAGKPWRGELYNLRRDGTPYVVEQTITPIGNGHGVITHFLAVQRDISERRLREESVRQLVTSDPLTGLPNGRALEAELGTAAAAATAGGAESALLLIHLEGATSPGDAAGAAAAEASVRDIATVLAHTLRPGDYLARLGEHEFAALLPGTPPDGAVIAADRLRSAVAQHAEQAAAAGPALAIGIGVATVDGTQSARGVLAMADAALYGSRDRGNSVALLPAAAADPVSEVNAEWAERIRSALRDDQFFLHFQPVVRLSTRALSHFDALLRLHDEDGEVIPARLFITHAEDLGLMPQIDRWVVENVMRLLQTAPDLRVSLNLSAATVTNAAFRQFLQRQRRRMAAVGGRIIFEVGEVAVMQDLPRMADHMRRLCELGCRFALDNFGITRSSLASLGALPVDYVKLDGSLVMGVDTDASRRDLVRALATLAHALGKEVIAGWAERASIVEVLPELGVEYAQGHHIGLPGPELRRDIDLGVERDRSDGRENGVLLLVSGGGASTRAGTKHWNSAALPQ